jgi:aminoglycoside phosphotransferase family enzyme/predicted kinase
LTQINGIAVACSTMLRMSGDPLVAEARTRVAALREKLEADEGVPVRLIETHVSWVLLAGPLAYKLKKPVRLGFLDFTSLAERRRCCAEELRLNGRFAPDLYLDLVEVRRGPHGPGFDGDGDGEVLDVAVRMRRFADGALWSERLAAGSLTPAQVDAFARRLAIAHGTAPVAPADAGFGAGALHARIVEGLVTAIDAWQAAGPSPVPEWPAARAWLREEVVRLERHWDDRLRAGAVRECHGDLHLANVVQRGDEAFAFDALEFAAELRWIDPLDDLAFLVMDLLASGRRDLGFRLLNAYLEESGDYEGMPALRFFLVSRALVRAEVAVLRGAGADNGADQKAALRYLRLACALARGRDARLAITCGLPGSGKTFVSQSLAETVGAVRVRSDVERKRLFGIAALESSHDRVPGGIYGAAASELAYARLLAVARVALRAGWPTLVDAAFLRRAERDRFRALATSCAAPFAILHCRADMGLLRERIIARRERGDDASEADLDVLERLSRVAEAPADDEIAATIVCDSASARGPAESSHLAIAAIAAPWRLRPGFARDDQSEESDRPPSSICVSP